MLKREDAHKMLQAEQSADWRLRRLAAIRNNVPGELRPVAYALLGHDEHGEPLSSQTAQDQQRRNELVGHGFQRLGELTSAQRLAVCTAFFPIIAGAVEAGWQLFTRLPYQTGWNRQAFRLPSGGEVTTAARRQWLHSLFDLLGPYREKDMAWLAAWAPYIGGYAAQTLGILFAAAIDGAGAEGQQVFEVLTASARGEHPIGAMGRHVTTALLVSARPEGWAFMERLLLAAQREEGLRQVILETVDEAHPLAFRRMLRLILDHDLIRFSATIRAADVWFGFGWDVDDARAVKETLSQALGLLDDASAREEAIAHGDAQTLYLALWACAFEDADATISTARAMLANPQPERRLVATHLLAQLGLRAAREALPALLDDPDLRVALRAFQGLRDHDGDDAPKAGDLFERLERLLARLGGQRKNISSEVWPWLRLNVDEEDVAGALESSLGHRSPRLLIPYLSRMSAGDRLRTAERLAKEPSWDVELRDALFGLIGDRSDWVRDRALPLIAGRQLTDRELPMLEALLTRKSSDLRRGVLKLLLGQCDDVAVASAERLLAARHPMQRLAGLDLLSELAQVGHAAECCRDAARRYRDNRAESQGVTSDEGLRLESILSAHEAGASPTRENVLGLISPDQRTKPLPPHRRPVTIDTPAARACLVTLDALVEAQRTTPIMIKTWHGSEEALLGNAGWQFPEPTSTLPAEDDARENLPLAEVWRQWERERPAALRDPDGLELVRALLLLSGTRAVTPAPRAGADAPQSSGSSVTNAASFGLPAILATLLGNVAEGVSTAAGGVWPAELSDAAPARGQLQHMQIVEKLLQWLVRLQEHAPEAAPDLLLDAAETALASIPREVLERAAAGNENVHPMYWRQQIGDGSLALIEYYRELHPDAWTDAHLVRYWHLLRWLDEPAPGIARRRPPFAWVLAAYRAGGATEADILEHLGGHEAYNDGYWLPWAQANTDLAMLSGRTPHPLMAEYPILQELLPMLRERILAVELARGEMPTAATPLAFCLSHSGGAALFIRLVAALAPTDLVRGYAYDNESRTTSFSHLLRATFPGAEETREQFARRVASAGLDATRLVAAAVYAPQWAGHVEHALQWPHLEDAIWWTHAHTKDSNWSVDQQLKETWQAQVTERTPLTGQELLDGAVDVEWFWLSYHGLDAQRWEEVYAAAKYAAGGTGHARARLFADAMTGKVGVAELCRRIATKRYQDSVRALGLVPLSTAPGTPERETELTERYGAIQEFLRTSRKFGAQRRASEASAARTGLENLARTAGYPDPVRLQWAMEARLAADLRDGALSATEGGVTVTLALDPFTAEPRLTVANATGRTLKSIPPRLKKNPEVAALVERRREVERQVARMRLSLEGAMCRGDRFRAAELSELLAHPVLARLLRNLIFVREADQADGVSHVLGYPFLPEGGESAPCCLFRAHDGAVTRVEAAATDLRLAHPTDLLAGGAWHAWQHDCFATERIQPFKQVFRELYLLSEGEQRHGDEALSCRYSGQQVQPRQAMALFGQRGWVGQEYEGVRRTFHAEGISAWVSFDYGAFTPAEVEGLTIAEVRFTRRGEWAPLPLASVPPRLFSEAMRDLDLVVSVAHRGGVDPEATASTVEMRAALVRETCALLGLPNVAIKSAHALIDGTLGSYSIHLGSAVVHRQPGGALCIVPVHAQHRGRLFLPFVDNDPRSAEVVSKVVLLARDSAIKDPSILEQIL